MSTNHGLLVKKLGTRAPCNKIPQSQCLSIFTSVPPQYKVLLTICSCAFLAVFARRLMLGYVRLLLVTSHLDQVELAWSASSLSQQSTALCPRMPQTVHTGTGCFSTGTPLRSRLAPDVLPRSWADSLDFSVLSLGSRLECRKFSRCILSRDLSFMIVVVR